MQVTETQTDGLKREFKVTVAAKDIDEKLDVRLEELGQQVNVPGFRPGKVPLAILKQRYGPSVMGEILEKAVQESSQQAMEERALRPAMQPKIEVTSFDKGQDLEYTLAVELLPDIDVMDFSKVEIEKTKIDIPDDEVEEALQRLAESQKRTEPLAEARAAETGDVLVIDFRGSVDGEELPGMAGEDHHLELGSNQFIQGFEDQLVGASKDDAREVKVTFPEEYVNDKLAGREAIFQVTVKDILASIPHPIDDTLAETLGESDLASVRDKLRQQIEGEYGQVTRARMKRGILDQLADGHDFPVPPGMVDVEFQTIWKQIEEDRQRGNSDPEDEGKSDDDLKAEYGKIAERRVRLGLLLSEVGRINEIDVSPDEINQALMQEARRHPGQERQVFEFFQKSPEAMASLRAPIFEDKVIDFIVDLAAVTERSISPEQLRDELAAEQAEEAGASDGEDEGAASENKPAASKPEES